GREPESRVHCFSAFRVLLPKSPSVAHNQAAIIINYPYERYRKPPLTLQERGNERAGSRFVKRYVGCAPPCQVRIDWLCLSGLFVSLYFNPAGALRIMATSRNPFPRIRFTVRKIAT